MESQLLRESAQWWGGGGGVGVQELQLPAPPDVSRSVRHRLFCSVLLCCGDQEIEISFFFPPVKKN